MVTFHLPNHSVAFSQLVNIEKYFELCSRKTKTNFTKMVSIFRVTINFTNKQCLLDEMCSVFSAQVLIPYLDSEFESSVLSNDDLQMDY